MPQAGSLVRKLLGLAWPVALARLGIMGMGVVDVMVVGQFAPAQLPYQALAWAPVGVLVVTGIGLLNGVQVLGARGIGAGTPEHAGSAWRRGIVVSMLAGALALFLIWILGARLFTAFGIAPALAVPSAHVALILALSVPLQLAHVACSLFLESIQKPLPGAYAMWLANVVNLGLNLWLVPRYGAVGSAWCTVVARLSLAMLVVAWIWWLRERERYGVRRFDVSEPSYKALLGVGGAAAVSGAAESGAFSGMTMLAGRLGGNAVSAYQILLNLLALVFMLSLGLSSATAVLTSDAVGRQRPADATRASFTGLGVNGVLMLLVGSAVFTFARFIGHAYTANAELATLVSGLLWLAALVMLPDGGQVVAAAALRARGDNWFPTASHLFAYACIMPALAFWLSETRGHGVSGLMFAILASSIVSFGALALRLWRLRGAQGAAS